MSDEEIKEKLADFEKVWKRVSGDRKKLPEGVKLYPGQKRTKRKK